MGPLPTQLKELYERDDSILPGSWCLATSNKWPETWRRGSRPVKPGSGPTADSIVVNIGTIPEPGVGVIRSMKSVEMPLSPEGLEWGIAGVAKPSLGFPNSSAFPRGENAESGRVPPASQAPHSFAREKCDSRLHESSQAGDVHREEPPPGKRQWGNCSKQPVFFGPPPERTLKVL